MKNSMWYLVRRTSGQRLAVVNVKQPGDVQIARGTYQDCFAAWQRFEARQERRKGVFHGVVIALSVALALFAASWMPAAHAADVTLNWQPPTQNMDGTPLTDLAGYRVYAGTGSRDYQSATPINDPAQTSATVPVTLVLFPGENLVYIAMTALDGNGNESPYSNEITRTVVVVDDVAPAAPIIITVTIEIGIDCPQGVTCTVSQ